MIHVEIQQFSFHLSWQIRLFILGKATSLEIKLYSKQLTLCCILLVQRAWVNTFTEKNISGFQSFFLTNKKYTNNFIISRYLISFSTVCCLWWSIDINHNILFVRDKTPSPHKERFPGYNTKLYSVMRLVLE